MKDGHQCDSTCIVYVYQSLYIYLHNLQWSVFVTNKLIRTQPQPDIVCSWLWELFAEPWWIIEGAASTGTPTSLTIPEWIIWVECIALISISASSLTEVVLANEGRYNSCLGEVWSSTGTNPIISSCFIYGCSKSPDMLYL